MTRRLCAPCWNGSGHRKRSPPPPPTRRRPASPLAAFSQVNGLAIASLLLAVLWFAGIGAVLALVFGYRARSQIKNSAGSQTGSGLATAGIILGWIGITILVVILIALPPGKP